MPGRELLERFRPASAPGAVGRVGVPSDVHEDAEVLAVLGALGPTVAQAQAIREQAQQGARALLEEAARQVQAIQARARLDAAEARAAAAARARETGRREGERLVAEAEVQASSLLAHGERDLPSVVDRVMSGLRAQVASAGRS
jgi:flagellar biosynthesis/type III secretory pathway protein FliH